MIQGGVIGMKREMPKLQATAQQAGRFSMPYDGSTRGDSYAYTSTRSVENNTVSPVFNLTINANGGDSRTLEQKVKGWVKDAIDDTFDMMSRKSPRLRIRSLYGMGNMRKGAYLRKLFKLSRVKDL